MAGGVHSQLDLGKPRKLMGWDPEVLRHEFLVELDCVGNFLVLDHLFESLLKVGKGSARSLLFKLSLV